MGALSRRTVLAATAALVLALTGCRDIVIGADGEVTSYASRAVSPTTATVSGRAVVAVEIRIRDCDRILWEEGSFDELTLRPAAVVTAANGTVLFQNTVFPYLEPSGSRVIEGTDGDADRIVVPVAGAATPLRIQSSCTSYAGIYNPPYKTTWFFPDCRTSTRRCPTTAAGEGELYDAPGTS